MEVLFAIGKKYEYNENKVIARRNEKRNACGGFEENIILKNVF